VNNELTSTFAVEVLLCGESTVLLLLSLSTLVEVFDDDAYEHVEHEEADEQQERDEVQQTPFVVVDLWLQRHASHVALTAVPDFVGPTNKRAQRLKRSTGAHRGYYSV